MTDKGLGTWRNPPLVYVVAELVISPHYGIPGAIADLQSALRPTYPRTVEGAEIAIDSPGSPPQKLWRFVASDEGRGVQVTTKTISLHATAYIDSKDFLSRWSAVLKSVGKSQLEPFVERAGLRYIDLIVPSDQRICTDYLAPGLHGISAPETGSIESVLWASMLRFGDTVVNVRIAAPAAQGNVLPPNFNAVPLKKPRLLVAAESRSQAGGGVGFVDTDCIRQVSEPFNAERIAGLYSEMQSKASSVFRATISDFAEKEWQ